jgi:hypothetical protein
MGDASLHFTDEKRRSLHEPYPSLAKEHHTETFRLPALEIKLFF